MKIGIARLVLVENVNYTKFEMKLKNFKKKTVQKANCKKFIKIG